MKIQSMQKKTVRIKTIYGEFVTWSNDMFAEQLIAYSAHTRYELAMLHSIIREGDHDY